MNSPLKKKSKPNSTDRDDDDQSTADQQIAHSKKALSLHLALPGLIWSDLPLEIWVIIFEYVGSDEIQLLASICSQWNEILLQSSAFWECIQTGLVSLYGHPYPKNGKELVESFEIFPFGRFLNKLDLVGEYQYLCIANELSKYCSNDAA